MVTPKRASRGLIPSWAVGTSPRFQLAQRNRYLVFASASDHCDKWRCDVLSLGQ